MKNTADLFASASRFAIAAAIVYFAYQLAQINSNVSVVTQSVDQVSQQFSPALVEAKEIRLEIGEVRKLVPQVLSEVAALREQIPIILKEAEQVRNSLPPILAEMVEVRQQIPPILAQIESMSLQIDPILQRIDQSVVVIDQTQRQIPEILATADRAINTLDTTREQLVPLVPQALEEVRLTRGKIDPTLDRVDDLVADTYFKAQDAIAAAQSAGQQASEGAVKGFFTGIIKLPFDLVGTLASPIVNNIDKDVAKLLTEKDIELMGISGKQVAESGNIDNSQRWKNPDSGNSGSITLLREFKTDDNNCVEVRIRISNRRREIMDKLDSYCRSDDDKWILAKQIEQGN
jgi:hypothetical protein